MAPKWPPIGCLLSHRTSSRSSSDFNLGSHHYEHQPSPLILIPCREANRNGITFLIIFPPSGLALSLLLSRPQPFLTKIQQKFKRQYKRQSKRSTFQQSTQIKQSLAHVLRRRRSIPSPLSLPYVIHSYITHFALPVSLPSRQTGQTKHTQVKTRTFVHTPNLTGRRTVSSHI